MASITLMTNFNINLYHTCTTKLVTSEILVDQIKGNPSEVMKEAVFNLEISQSGSNVPHDILNWVISKMVWIKL